MSESSVCLARPRDAPSSSQKVVVCCFIGGPQPDRWSLPAYILAHGRRSAEFNRAVRLQVILLVSKNED